MLRMVLSLFVILAAVSTAVAQDDPVFGDWRHRLRGDGYWEWSVRTLPRDKTSVFGDATSAVKQYGLIPKEGEPTATCVITFLQGGGTIVEDRACLGRTGLHCKMTYARIPERTCGGVPVPGANHARQ